MPVPHNHTFTNIPGAMLNAALLPGKLNICHGNAQSLCARKNAKLEEVRVVLSSHKVDIACFTESWLTASRNNRSIGVQGYTVVRNDRVFKRGGGIAVYYQENMSCTKIFNTELTTESADKTECLALEFRLNERKLLQVVVYNPPENNCATFLEEQLTGLMVRYESVFLVGDLNTDLLQTSNKRSQLLSAFESLSLAPCGSEPTHYHDNGCSQLDLLVTNESAKVLRFGQVEFPGLSQHDLIYASLDFDAIQPPTVNTYRDYVHFDADVLKTATTSIPWINFYEISDPNDALEFFTEQLKTVHDNCFPLRTSSCRKRSNRWFTADVQKALLERDLAYKDWLTATRDVKDFKRRRYKTLRNHANSVIERAKMTFLGGYLDVSISSKLLWTRVRSLGVGKDKSSQPCDHEPDEVNRMFLSSFTPADTSNNNRSRTPPSPYNFSFRSVHHWEVVNAICEVKSNAVGMDGLPISFLKIVLPLIIQQITHMFNLFINTSTFPNRWKHAKVLPLKKKPNSSDMTNLRPISILCSLSKAFEKLLDQQMANYIDNNHLLSEYQAGFQKNQGVKTAVLRVHDDLASTVDKRGVGVLILLDFSKAFDTIPHNKLLEKLETQFNFSSTAVNLMDSYLRGRKQTVFCDGRSSDSAEPTSGVPQGSIVGPRLFCCHINDLPSVLKHCSIQLYADDVQLYLRGFGPCARSLIDMANEDLQNVADWSNRNRLLVNPAKSKALFIQSANRRTGPTPELRIEMNGEPIQWTERASNLGFVFQSDLQWDGLVAQQCGKIYAGLRTLYTCTLAAPVATKLKLFQALVLPHFLFADIFFVNLSSSLFNRLRLALNCCVRYVYGLRRRDHVSHLQKNLVGCPIQNLFAYRSCLFLRNLMSSRTPPAVYQKLIPSRSQRLRNLIVPANRTTGYANTMFVRGVVYWNSLPPDAKHSRSEADFKRRCKDFYNVV